MNKWGIRLLFIFFIYFQLVFGEAQPLHLISVDFNRTINCIYQDSNYYLWLGTDDGLYRYDGNKFIAHKIDPYKMNSISDDHITAISEDHFHTLFIGTKYGGVNLFNFLDERFSSTNNDFLSEITINAISTYKNTTLVGTDIGLFLLSITDNCLNYQPILENQKITDIKHIDENNLVVSTENNGFYHFINFHEDKTDWNQFLDGTDIKFVLPVKKNINLISTHNGYYYFNSLTKELKKLEALSKVYSVNKNAIALDHGGEIWLGTGYKLFKISIKDDFDSIDIDSFDLDIDNKFSTGINALFFDHSGVLWINLKGKGLYKYYPSRKFSHCNVENGLMSNIIFSVAENNSHSILIGTHHGIFVYDLNDHSVERIPGTEELDFQVITAMYKDPFQNLWCGTNNGLFKLTSNNQLIQYKHSSRELSSISSDFISSIVGDPVNIGDVWIGTSDGLNRYRRGYDNFIHYFHDQNDVNSIAGNSISCLLFSEQKDLWIGTSNSGLSKLKYSDLNNFAPNFFNYSDDLSNHESISDRKITYLTEDLNHTIWIGTENGGLNAIDSNIRFRHYLETNGLQDNHILSIVPSPNKTLWIATRDGIAKFDIEQGFSKNYCFKDGIKKGEFIERSACITNNGNIIFGSKAGFTIFHPDQITNNENPAIPQINGVFVYNKKLNIDAFRKSSEYIDLNHDQNVISFDICGLHYVSPNDNKLSYFLEGVDENWSTCSNFEYITYSNVLPGKYTFHLKVANNDNIWNENEKSIKIHIATPFWSSAWFKFMILISIAAVAYFFIRQRLNIINQKKIHLERQIRDKIKANEELNIALAKVEELKSKLEDENTYLKNEIQITSHSKYKDIVTSSKNMKHILSQVDIASGADPTILILGESGTGKDLLAHAIHKSSSRSSEAFIKVDCAALPPNLIESELFGHEKGAFTSANKRKIGRFELANGGTIFLDEIGELPIKVQQKLLRVLQSGEFERLGNSMTLRTNTRIIAATNRNLEEEVKNGQFREDLYYRLNVFPINIPPLRERMEDVPMLVQHFIDKYAGKFNKKITKVSQKTIAALMSYNWPGNIRELENIVQRAIIISRDEVLELGDWLNNNRSRSTISDENIFVSLEEVQKRHIEKILEYTNGKVSGQNGAAEILKINPKTLFSRIKKLNINN